MFSKNLLKDILKLGIVVSLFSGCGGGGSKSSSSTDTKQTTPQTKESKKIGTGTYIDAVVEGVGYECGAISGVTDSDGKFTYEIGNGCTLKIGSLTLRVVDGSKLDRDGVVIQETNEKVSQLLLSLNVSKEPKKLIKIDKIVAKEFSGEFFDRDIKDANISELIREAESQIKEKGIKKAPLEIVKIESAKEHLKDSYRSHFQEDGFRLADDNTLIFQDLAQDVDATAKKSPKKEQKTTSNKEKNTNQTPNNNGAKDDTKGATTTVESYSYIPKGDKLTDRMAIKFLNMATFGATPKLVAELKSKGVINWVDEQLNQDYSRKDESILRRLISMALEIDEDRYKKGKNCSMDDWFDPDSGCYFNQALGGGRDLMRLHLSAIFNANLAYKNQLRQRVAYALSQLVIVSQSNDRFFTYHAEALSAYYDILLRDAFKGYDELLYDISLSPAMGVYLSFLNNQKAHEDPKTHTIIYPDENYGREIMQLFSIGLFEMNMDGTLKRVDGKRVATYVQDDVMNMSRVFTGLRANNSQFNASYLRGDLTNPMVCEMDYHDTEAKRILGATIPSGKDCYQDIKSAISLLVNHQNIAPFISKKLILRLTKSNPTTAYVQRVAEVFKNSRGSLKETVKAVLLDREIWEDIKADRGTKLKEPYITFIELLREIDAKPVPVVTYGNIRLENTGFFTDGLYDRFGQWPTASPTVFNFYSDDFTPDYDEFKVRGFVAPESEIITSGYNVKLINSLNDMLCKNSPQVRGTTPQEHPEYFTSNHTRFYVEYKDIIDVFKKNGFGEELDKGSNDTALKEKVAEKVVDYISYKLLGKGLSPEKKELLVNAYKDSYWPKKNSRSTMFMERLLIENWIRGIIIDIYFSSDFMIQ